MTPSIPTTTTMTMSTTASITPPIVHYLCQPSPLGDLIIAATELGLCGLYFEQHKYFRGITGWQHTPAQRHLVQAAMQLDDYFDGKLTRFTLPLDLTGTPFQRSVWQALDDIGFGDTVSYSDHARRIDRPSAVRAVGTAIGRNPVSIVVPCHRVIGNAGSLAGYAGGLERKQFLLALERRQ